jgi:hypothetical protein
MVKNYPVRIKPHEGVSKPNSYQEDFLYLKGLALAVVPLADKYFPPEKRAAMEKDILARLGDHQCAKEEFFHCISRYLAGFANEHACIAAGVLGNSHYKIVDKDYYPVLLHHVGSDWYLWNVATTFDYDPSIIGRKVTAINGRPMAAVEELLGTTMSADNVWSRRASMEANIYYSRPALYRLAGLIDSSKNTLKLEFEGHAPADVSPLPGFAWRYQPKPHPITARSKNFFDGRVFPEQNYAYFQFNACFDKSAILDGVGTIKPLLRPFVRLWLKHQLNRKKPSSKLAGYFDSERPSLKDYLASFIQEVNQKGVHNLIIDLRNNNGGEHALPRQLIYHLTRREDLIDLKRYSYNPSSKQLSLLPPDNKGFFSGITDPKSLYYVASNRPVFSGKVIVLANYNTHSAASILTTLLQDNRLAVVVGTTMDNNPTGPTGMTLFQLPRTKLRVSLPLEYYERPAPANGELFKPDFWIENTAEDLLTGRDAAFEKAMALVHE